MALMDVLAHEFGSECAIGYSDHVAPDVDGAMPALEYAALRGAVVLEKHFTFDKSLPGNDHYHSLNEAEMKAFTQKLATYRTLHGDEDRKLDWEAQAVSHARRRIMAASDIKAGEVLSEDKLIALRSGVGIEIAKWDDVVGKTVKNDIAAQEPVEWDDVA